MIKQERTAAPLPLQSSREWLERARKVVPGATQTFSKGPSHFVEGASPHFIAGARGAMVWDVDGNRYIDYILGLGPVILGHADPVVNQAAWAQMQDGISFSLPHTLEVEVAERLCELVPCAQMARFGKNGSDATAGAVRVARAYTGRDKVACCGYHGWQDWFIGATSRSLGVPLAVRRLTLPFPYDDLEALHRLFQDNPEQIACVIMEPVTFTLPQEGYLEGVQALCRRHGALLIFDEVITGFRLAMGGAQEVFGVTPDLACLGKAMANGFPLSAIVGRADVMRLFADVFFSFTYGGEAVSLAACKATLRELERRDVIGHLGKVGARLQAETNRLSVLCGLSEYVTCVGLPPWTGLVFQDAEGNNSLLLRSLFQQECVKRGLLTHGNHMLSCSHDEAILDATLRIYADVFPILAEAVLEDDIARRLEGAPMQPVFRQAG